MNTTVDAELAAERELTAALMEQLSYLRAGCLNQTREELIRRITAISAPEWQRGVWLGDAKRASVTTATAELRETITELRAQVQGFAGVTDEDNNDWTGS